MGIKLNFTWPGQLWAISDLHFNDQSVLDIERKEFESLEEHNNHIVESINNKVHKGDTLLILGDMGEEFQDYLAQINGYKVLVKGNHDKLSNNVYKNYFDEVYNGPLFLTPQIIISHEPIPVSSNYFINVHGHLHGANLDSKAHVNLSAAMIDYTPVNLIKLAKEMTPNLKRIRGEKFLSEWYADLYVFTGTNHKDSVPYFSNGKILPFSKFVVDLIYKYAIDNNINFDGIEFSKIDFDSALPGRINYKYNKFYSQDEIKNIIDAVDKYMAARKNK